MMYNKCIYCGKLIDCKAKYCSDKCRKLWHYHNHLAKKTCLCCKNDFVTTRNTKYCSESCRKKSVVKKIKTCEFCGKRFKGRWDKRYCSTNCYRLANDKSVGFEIFNCIVCGTPFRRKKGSNAISCGDSCGPKVKVTIVNEILKNLIAGEYSSNTKERLVRAYEKNIE